MPAEDRKPIRLNGDRHESVLTERRGLFRVICGCRWDSDFADLDVVEKRYDEHLAYMDAEADKAIDTTEADHA